jgi:hypothetical protein
MALQLRFLGLACGAVVCIFLAGRVSGQPADKKHFIPGPQKTKVCFEHAIGFSKVPIGSDPTKVGFEVLIVTAKSPKGEWQPARHDNSQFYIDAPKYGTGDGQPPRIDRTIAVDDLPLKRGPYPHAGSYAEFTQDPHLPLMLSERGDDNRASTAMVISRGNKGAAPLYATLGLEDRASILGVDYTASHTSPMLLRQVTLGGRAVISYSVEANAKRRGSLGLVGRITDPRADNAPFDLSKPCAATSVIELFEGIEVPLLLGARHVPATDAAGLGVPPGTSGFTVRAELGRVDVPQFA